MSIVSQATRRLALVDPPRADRVQAFLEGYCGLPLEAHLDADPQLRQDWEHGKNRAKVEAQDGHH